MHLKKKYILGVMDQYAQYLGFEIVETDEISVSKIKLLAARQAMPNYPFACGLHKTDVLVTNPFTLISNEIREAIVEVREAEKELYLCPRIPQKILTCQNKLNKLCLVLVEKLEALL